jgi:RES domain-containing protein
MLVFRIVFKVFSKELIATGFEGRWNTEGKKVIYAAGSIALAFLENMVRRQGVGFNDDFKIMTIDIPNKLNIDSIDPGSLKPGWKSLRDYSFCQSPGDAWYNNNLTPVLKVPSVIIPDEFNYVINAAHADFKKIRIIDTTNLVPDPRIDEILKRYPGK